MPKPGTNHRVTPGECMTSLCFESGYADASRVLATGANAELQQHGRRVNMLVDGDTVSLPPIDPRWVELAPGPTHRFRLRRAVTTHIRLELGGGPEGPWSARPFELVVDGETLRGSTGADGSLDVEIPILARSAVLRLFENEDASLPIHEVELMIGHLDPIETVTGLQARLNAIGFACGNVDGDYGPKTTAAVIAFQDAFDALLPDGIAGPKTQASLRRVYGC